MVFLLIQSVQGFFWEKLPQKKLLQLQLHIITFSQANVLNSSLLKCFVTAKIDTAMQSWLLNDKNYYDDKKLAFTRIFEFCIMYGPHFFLFVCVCVKAAAVWLQE